MSRWSITVLAALVVLSAWWSAPAASAHNRLIFAEPASGAVVARAPRQVTLTFAQPVLGIGSAATLTGPAGLITTGPPRAVDNTLTVPVPPGSPAGPYEVFWRTTSTDGHPVSGRLRFTASAASAAGGDSPEAQPSPSAPGVENDQGGSLGWAAALVLAALLAGVGLGVLRRRRP